MDDNRAAVFLDRDGVLNQDTGYIRSIEELKIFDYVPECIRRIHELGYLAIVISNQSGIARGIIDESAVETINFHLQQQTGVDAVYYCPHYEKGVVKRYSISCDCRKPKTGMIDKACEDFSVERAFSVMVGDRLCDMQLGRKAELYNYLVQSGYEEEWDAAKNYADCIMGDLRDVLKDLCNKKGRARIV